MFYFFCSWKKKDINKLNLLQKDFSICTEFIIKAHKNFKCMKFYPKRKRLHGVSKVNKFFDGLTILNNILKLYFK